MLRFIKEKPRVPQMRFGSGTEPFDRKRLDEITSKKISYGIVQAGDHVPDGMPYIKSQDLNGPLTLERLERTSAEIARKYRRSEVLPSDIVFSLRGNIGVAQIVPDSIAISNLTQGTARISVDQEYNKYICCTLQSSDIVRQVQAYAKGSTFREISLEDLRKVTVALPTLPEQKKIADFLTSVDERIGQLIKKKALLEDYKKGVMQQLFSQKIRFKDDSGNDFPDWEGKKFGEVCEITMGQSPDSKSYNEVGDGLPLIQGNADIKKRKSCPRIWTSEPTKVCIDGDLLLTVRAPVGAIARSEHHACLGRGVASIRSKPKATQDFIYQWLLEFEHRWICLEQGSTFTAVSGKDIRGLLINIPTVPEQKKIADFLTSVDQKIESVSHQIAKTQTFKKGLLQQMFV